MEKMFINVLDQTQSGFRKGRSCIDSAFTLKVLSEEKKGM